MITRNESRCSATLNSATQINFTLHPKSKKHRHQEPTENYQISLSSLHASLPPSFSGGSLLFLFFVSLSFLCFSFFSFYFVLSSFFVLPSSFFVLRSSFFVVSFFFYSGRVGVGSGLRSTDLFSFVDVCFRRDQHLQTLVLAMITRNVCKCSTTLNNATQINFTLHSKQKSTSTKNKHKTTKSVFPPSMPPCLRLFVLHPSSFIPLLFFPSSFFLPSSFFFYSGRIGVSRGLRSTDLHRFVHVCSRRDQHLQTDMLAHLTRNESRRSASLNNATQINFTLHPRMREMKAQASTQNNQISLPSVHASLPPSSSCGPLLFHSIFFWSFSSLFSPFFFYSLFFVFSCAILFLKRKNRRRQWTTIHGPPQLCSRLLSQRSAHPNTCACHDNSQ